MPPPPSRVRPAESKVAGSVLLHERPRNGLVLDWCVPSCRARGMGARRERRKASSGGRGGAGRAGHGGGHLSGSVKVTVHRADVHHIPRCPAPPASRSRVVADPTKWSIEYVVVKLLPGAPVPSRARPAPDYKSTGCLEQGSALKKIDLNFSAI